MNKYYHFNQNNSGGYFIEDEKHGIGSDIIIEAPDAIEANRRLREIGDNVDDFWDYCECCGERWCDALMDEGEDEPKIYGKPVNECEKGMFRYEVYIHYIDKPFKRIGLTND